MGRPRASAASRTVTTAGWKYSITALRWVGVCRWLTGAIALALFLGVVGSYRASAGVMIQDVCVDGEGHTTSADGWSESDGGGWRGGTSLGSVQTCAGGGVLGLSLGHDFPTNVGHELEWTYTAPANTRISAFNLREWYYIDWPIGGYGNPNYGNPYAFRSWHDDWALNDFFETPLPPYKGTNNSGWHNLTQGNVNYGSLNFFITCADDGNPTGGDCMSPSGTEWQLSAGQISLLDETAPQIGQVSGSLTTAGEKRGTVSISFNASDTGVGVYRAIYSVDGTVVNRQVVDSNGGHCAALTSGYVFGWTVPCKLSLSASLSFNTSTLTDGAHTVGVAVEDASGNSAIVWEGTITTHNAPQMTTRPAINGVARTGAPLSASSGSWTPTPASFTYQWLRCPASVTAPVGDSCTKIAGATSAQYSAAGEDVYSRLMVDVTASNANGSTEAFSAPTDVIADALGRTSPPGDGGSAGNGSGGSGGPGGSGGSAAPITINLPGSNQGLVALGNKSRWRISMSVAPRVVRKHSKIRLTGKVTTSPRPKNGKLVYLQARGVSTGRRHGRRVYGKWVTFKAFRAKANGSFASVYRFKLGGRHLYQFRAVAPAEGQYRNLTGTSRVITVREN